MVYLFFSIPLTKINTYSLGALDSTNLFRVFLSYSSVFFIAVISTTLKRDYYYSYFSPIATHDLIGLLTLRLGLG
jgi:hypothetical protein